MSLEFVKPENINLKNHPEFNEKWVQDVIAKDPSILGLGDLILKDKERNQPRAGRLDLLLQDEDAQQRYEVEIQLGEVDESHIIRTIEYWDIERKRYPQYDHFAVIIAEDITSRFLNVISLFNGNIPIIAIQMKAIKINNNISLIFTTVLDDTAWDIDDDAETEVTDRNYWEQRGSKNTVVLVDEIFGMVKSMAPDSKFELKYNKFYIGLLQNEQINNFVIFRPQKTSVRFDLRIPKTKEMDDKIESKGLNVIPYDNQWKRYRINLNKEDITKHKEFIMELLKIGYDNSK